MAALSVYAGPALGAEGEEPVEAVELFDSDIEAGEKPEVKVGDLGQVTITAKDTDISMVLRILSMQSKRNIIASRNVSGTVSANLYDVDFYDALDAILHPNGFGYEEKGNFIYVYTQQELEEIQDANRKRMHKVIPLNYISAADASAFVAPLLSSDGSITASAEAEAGFQPSLSAGGENTFAHADTLLVVDYEENVDEIMAVLGELDIKPRQVMLEATVLQVRLTEENSFGIDFAVYGDIGIDDIVTPLGAVDNLISKTGAGGAALDSGQGIQTSAGNVSAGKAGVKVGLLGSDASIFLRALDSVQDTNVLATPKILALNRQRAEILIGERLGYLSTTQTDTSTTSTVEFLDVGTQLTVRPFISADDYVRMELRPTVSDGDTSRVVDGNVIPDETTNELVTNVIVRNGQTVVLGGLFTEDTSTSRSQLPGVGHIPVVGLLGKGQDDTIRRSEVIFLVKPTIMKDEPLEAMGTELANYAMDSMPGIRKGLLPFSRTKLTAAHMAKAHKFIEQGDEKKALWNLNLALHLDPTMVEALRMKQAITGEQLFYQNYSILNEVVDGLVDEQTDDLLPADLLEDEEMTDALDEALGDAEATPEASAEAQAGDDVADADEAAEPEQTQADADEPGESAEWAEATEAREPEVEVAASTEAAPEPTQEDSFIEDELVDEVAAEMAEAEAEASEPVAGEQGQIEWVDATEQTADADQPADTEAEQDGQSLEEIVFWEQSQEPAEAEDAGDGEMESIEFSEVDPSEVE